MTRSSGTPQILHKTRMARHSSKTLSLEPYTSSNDFEGRLHTLSSRHTFRSGKEKKEYTAPKPKLMNGRITLRLGYKSRLLYRTLSEDARKSYEETVKAFRRHSNKKPVVFSGRLAWKVHYPGEKLTDFLGDLQTLALKAYPQESNETREPLI